MKISNTDGVEFAQAVTVPAGTLDGHVINKGQADDAYAPITQMGIPIPVNGDWATGTNMLDDIQNVLGVVPGQVVVGTVFASVFDSFSLSLEIYDDGSGVAMGILYNFGTFPSAGTVYFHIKELRDI